VNVREVVLTSDVASVATERLQLVPKALGPRLGKDVQNVIRAHKAGDWSETDGVITVGGVELLDGEYTLELVARDGVGDGAGDGDGGVLASAGLSRTGGVVALDIAVNDELEIEGAARDLVRLIQQKRKEYDYEVTDRIRLTMRTDAHWAQVWEQHSALVERETLIVGSDVGMLPDGSSDELVWDIEPA